MASDDSFFYIGTTTGDILKMNPRTKLLVDTGPVKDKFSLVSRQHHIKFCSGLLLSSDFLPPLVAQTYIKKKFMVYPKPKTTRGIDWFPKPLSLVIFRTEVFLRCPQLGNQNCTFSHICKA